MAVILHRTLDTRVVRAADIPVAAVVVTLAEVAAVIRAAVVAVVVIRAAAGVVVADTTKLEAA